MEVQRNELQEKEHVFLRHVLVFGFGCGELGFELGFSALPLCCDGLCHEWRGALAVKQELAGCAECQV